MFERNIKCNFATICFHLVYFRVSSQKLYKEDWEYDKHKIYYPVHITPGYEQALDASKFQSDVSISNLYADISNSPVSQATTKHSFKYLSKKIYDHFFEVNNIILNTAQILWQRVHLQRSFDLLWYP